MGDWGDRLLYCRWWPWVVGQSLVPKRVPSQAHGSGTMLCAGRKDNTHIGAAICFESLNVLLLNIKQWRREQVSYSADPVRLARLWPRRSPHAHLS